MSHEANHPESAESAGVDRRLFCGCALALGATLACGGGGGSSSSGGGGDYTPPPTPGNLVTTTDTKAALLAQAAGTVRDYTSGTTACPSAVGAPQGVYLVRDAAGIFAVSASCLHQGGRIKPGSGGFSCPCHGSTYDLIGTATGGPAPVGSVLPHYEVKEPTPGAALVIDLGKIVAAGVRLS